MLIVEIKRKNIDEKVINNLLCSYLMTIPTHLNICSTRVMSSFMLLALYSGYSHVYNINYFHYLCKTIAWFPKRSIASLPGAAKKSYQS